MSQRKAASEKSSFELVAENRKARHDFFIEDSIECGIALTGTEVKALREHKVSLRNSYARIRKGEVFLTNVHIGAYEAAGHGGHDEKRARKLLLHRHEIDRLWSKVRERGYTLVPLRIYFKRGLAKVELALVRGKRQYDKRAAIARKEDRREMERVMKRKVG